MIKEAVHAHEKWRCCVLIDYRKKYEELLVKYEKLINEHKELLEKCMSNNSRLLSWNESMTKTVAYVSILIFLLTLLYSRPDILILVINAFSR